MFLIARRAAWAAHVGVNVATATPLEFWRSKMRRLQIACIAQAAQLSHKAGDSAWCNAKFVGWWV